MEGMLFPKDATLHSTTNDLSSLQRTVLDILPCERFILLCYQNVFDGYSSFNSMMNIKTGCMSLLSLCPLHNGKISSTCESTNNCLFSNINQLKLKNISFHCKNSLGSTFQLKWMIQSIRIFVCPCLHHRNK